MAGWSQIYFAQRIEPGRLKPTAETLATAAGNHCVDSDREMCVGLEINCNHIRAARQGIVTATATPLHLGRRSHVREIRTVDDADRLVTASRLTCTVVERP